MPFVVTKFLDHGVANPIVARLDVRIYKVLDQCDVASDVRDKIGALSAEFTFES